MGAMKLIAYVGFKLNCLKTSFDHGVTQGMTPGGKRPSKTWAFLLQNYFVPFIFWFTAVYSSCS